jgi:flagellar motor switch/type III secretory pathway protein FliN
VIAELTFGRPDTRGVRLPMFVRRASIPIGAACVVASGIRETLRELFGERCEVAIGEPQSIGGDAWRDLTRNAHCYLTPGRQTDIVLVVPGGDARSLVSRVFGEEPAPGNVACSTLELHAIERIVSRCALAFDPLCAERRGPPQALKSAQVPQCVAFFDVRVLAPIVMSLGVGIVRDLPDPGPSGTLRPSALNHVPVEMRVEFASGTMDSRDFLNLRAGDLVRLDTKVGSPGSLNLGGQRIAAGTCGSIASRNAFEIHDVDGRGVQP